MSEWYMGERRVDSLMDRAMQYGDGVFETIAIRQDEPRLWPLHTERLQLGCERIGLPAPTDEVLRNALTSALRETTLPTTRATAKLIVSAGDSPRGYRRNPAAETTLIVGIFASPGLDSASYQSGIRVHRCNTRLAVQPQLAGIKSLNRLEQVLARAEWSDPTIAEGLMSDMGGRLICGTMSNVFVVFNDGLVTPGVTRCGVSGVMRQHLLGLLVDADIACDIRDIHADELTGASEVFMTNSQLGAVPVRQIAETDLAIGPMTRRIQNLLADNGVPECGV